MSKKLPKIFFFDDDPENVKHDGSISNLHVQLVEGNCGLTVEDILRILQLTTEEDIIYLDFDGTLTTDEYGYIGSCSRRSIMINIFKRLFGDEKRIKALETLFKTRNCKIITCNPAIEDIDILLFHLASKHISIILSKVGYKISHIYNNDICNRHTNN